MSSDVSRRDFLQRMGVLVSSSGLLPPHLPDLNARPFPPHRAITVPGLHAYGDRLSVPAGGEIAFHVSSDKPYTVRAYRLGPELDDPAFDEPMSAEVSVAAPSVQPIHPGSYVHVEKGLPGTPLRALTLECWVRPLSRPFHEDPEDPDYNGLITQLDLLSAGYGLLLRSDLQGIGFYLGDGAAFDFVHLLDAPFDLLGAATGWHAHQWHHVVGTWDGEVKQVWIDGLLTASAPFSGPLKAGKAPLRIGAFGVNGEAAHFLNGDLALPVIYGRALAPAEIQARYERVAVDHLPPGLPGGKVLAAWPFKEEGGAHVADMSAFHRSGWIVNHATWQIGGPSFDASSVPRFGDYDPGGDATRGHALRFASDDLFDCRWSVSHTYTVPYDARPGLYVARFRYANPGSDDDGYYHVTFIVSSPKRVKKPIVVVCPTNTWLAYNSKPFLQPQPRLKQRYDTSRRDENSAPHVPMFSAYHPHQSDVPAYHLGLLMPLPAADPYGTFGSDDYSHLTRATRQTLIWLEREGFDFDVRADLDLEHPLAVHREQIVILPGHSEYWSASAFTTLKRFLNRGGRLVVLSGNTMYWRVSFNREETIMEVRKVEGAGADIPPHRRGEAWHGDDGLRGGLMREAGYPGWEVIGLETLAIINPSGNPAGGPTDASFGSLYVTTPAHPLFAGLWVTAGQAFALNLVGHESDVRVGTLEALRAAAGLPVPAGATVPVEPPGLTTLAQGLGGDVSSAYYWSYFLQDLPIPPSPRVADVIYWERPEGGRVFNGAAIANGTALLHDPVFAGLMRNVLLAFST